jgi:hypothetical protein
MQQDTPLFDEDEDDDDEDDGGNSAPSPSVARGAAWDAGDNSVVFQGGAVRMAPIPFTEDG